MPTARMAPPTAGGVAGRGLATVKAAGFAAVGRIRQASVPVDAGERPVEDAGEAVDQVATAEEVGSLRADREAAVGGRVEDELAAVGIVERDVLAVVVVIEDDSAPRAPSRCAV